MNPAMAMDSSARLPRPVALRVITENIPEELKLLRQWVVWKYEFDEGRTRWTKPPWRADGRGHASSTNPTTWSEYETALAAYRKDGFDGIGFVLTTDLGIVGVDLDHCYNPATKTLAPWATTIIDHFNSYTEVSPSGTGARIFLRGQLPAGGHKKGNIEIYSGGRYLTVTGCVLQKCA